MPGFIETKFIEKFKNKASFSREELFEFFRHLEPDLKEGTFAWRIYNLKEKNIIKSLKRGLYTISTKPIYETVLSSDIIKLSKSIQQNFSEVKHCIWQTNWLNEFSQHQSNKRIIIIEVEKDFAESVYFFLKDTFKLDLYLNPKEKEVEFYISESNNPIVVKNLITRSPIARRVQNKLSISVPFLEKILVDLFADEKLFYLFQGSELIKIFENAISNYTINFTKLFSYAKRREREQEIKSFITNNMDYLLKDIIDD